MPLSGQSIPLTPRPIPGTIPTSTPETTALISNNLSFFNNQQTLAVTARAQAAVEADPVERTRLLNEAARMQKEADDVGKLIVKTQELTNTLQQIASARLTSGANLKDEHNKLRRTASRALK